LLHQVEVRAAGAEGVVEECLLGLDLGDLVRGAVQIGFAILAHFGHGIRSVLARLSEVLFLAF